MTFGTTLINSCNIDLTNLISGNKEDHPISENYFFEMYFRDYDGDLVDVPVLIRNFYDSNGG